MRIAAAGAGADDDDVQLAAQPSVLTVHTTPAPAAVSTVTDRTLPVWQPRRNGRRAADTAHVPTSLPFVARWTRSFDMGLIIYDAARNDEDGCACAPGANRHTIVIASSIW